MFRFSDCPVVLIRRQKIEKMIAVAVLESETELNQNRIALRSSNAELAKCLSLLFEQKRKHDEDIAHLAELLRGSSCTIGGVEFRYKS